MTQKKKLSIEKPALPQQEKIELSSRLPERLIALLQDLQQAINYRKYNEAERIGHELLDVSPSEEVDCFIHEIITSATTIIDAEDEIKYQFSDLQTALKNTSEEDLSLIEEHESDGL